MITIKPQMFLSVFCFGLWYGDTFLCYALTLRGAKKAAEFLERELKEIGHEVERRGVRTHGIVMSESTAHASILDANRARGANHSTSTSVDFVGDEGERRWPFKPMLVFSARHNTANEIRGMTMPEEFLSANSSIKDPIIIEPEGLTPEMVWEGCKRYVEQCGGPAYDDGEPNWRAAFGADPGCCSCPNCKQYFWSCGRVIQCTECGFQFPSDWWAMYSYGVGDAKTLSGETKFPDGEVLNRIRAGINERMPQRMKHPYYAYGFSHPVESAWLEHDKLPWKEIMAASAP